MFSFRATICLATLAAAVIPSPSGHLFSEAGLDNHSSPGDSSRNLNKDQLSQIAEQAHGILPNGLPSQTLSAEGATNLKLIAFNELFEVAFFTELHQNVSRELPGYDLGSSQGVVLDTLSAIIAQENLHALVANDALQQFGYPPIQACVYRYPVSEFRSAVALASTFTAVVLGTLQDVNQIFAQNNDFALVRTISSVIGNEGEQEGFFRLAQGKRASSQPFLTTSVRDFAFTAILSFAEPNSCPNKDEIPLKQFKPLILHSIDIGPATRNIGFSFAKRDTELAEYSKLRLVFINQQNVPVVQQMIHVEARDDDIFFEVLFPFEEHSLSGLTVTAVTYGEGPFVDANAVAEAAIFGPVFIEAD